MSDILESLVESGQLSEEQLDRARHRASQFVKEALQDPELHEKLANIFTSTASAIHSPAALMAGKVLGGTALMGAGMSGGAKAIDMIHEKIQNKREALQKADHFQQMIAATPQLQESSVDSRMVQRHFDTLHKFNPSYASDPVLAGAYVRNTLYAESPSLDTINNMVRARSEIAKTEDMRAKRDTPGDEVFKRIEQGTKLIGTAIGSNEG